MFAQASAAQTTQMAAVVPPTTADSPAMSRNSFAGGAGRGRPCWGRGTIRGFRFGKRR
jgi:hypothetical protein